MKSMLLTHSGNPSNSAVNYAAMGRYAEAWNATEANITRTPVSAAGNIDGITVRLSGAPGVGASRTFTLRKNGSDTAVTVTISGTDTTGTSTSNSVAVSAGDLLSIGTTPTNTPAASFDTAVSLRLDSTTDKESNLIGGTATSSLATSGTEYVGFANATTPSGTETDKRGVCGTSGTVKNLYVALATAPGVGTSRTFTVVKNGSDTTCVVTISDAATTGSDTTHTFTVAAGDELSIKSTVSGTPAASRVGYAATFLADTSGESCILGIPSSTGDGSTTYYSVLTVFGANTTEGDIQDLGFACTLKNLYVATVTAPGGAASVVYTMRLNAAASALTATMTGAAVTANDTSNTVTVAEGDRLGMEVDPVSSPSQGKVRWGMVATFAAAQTFLPKIRFVI